MLRDNIDIYQTNQTWQSKWIIWDKMRRAETNLICEYIFQGMVCLIKEAEVNIHV